jgi:DNA adenine methylase
MNKTTFHGYFGAKNRMGTNFISRYIPTNIKTYVEPFSGSFGIYFQTDFNPNTKIIYNDVNRDQANLFYCSRNHRAFIERITYHLYEKDGILAVPKGVRPKEHYKNLYYSVKDSDFSTQHFELGDYDRASMYAFLLNSAFNSCHYMAAGFSGFDKDRLKLLSFVDKLNDGYIQNKLEKIYAIETEDFEVLIKKYDSPETYFYLDPPYFSEDDRRAGWYGVGDEFNYQAHMRLLELLKTIKGLWSLSYYYFPELEKMLPRTEYRWFSKKFFRSSASFSDKSESEGEELLIMNYDHNKGKESVLSEFFSGE